MRDSLRATLTRASALDLVLGGRRICNVTGSLGILLAAQVLLSLGCVVPLAYEEEEMTSGNYPPIIRGGNPTMGYSPVVLEITTGAPPVWSVDVEDQDVDDTLHVRVLRDYDPASPTPPVFQDLFAPNGEPERTLQMPTAGWCVATNPTRSSHLFEVVVADGPFDNTRPFHNVVEGADSSTRAWRADCVPGDGT